MDAQPELFFQVVTNNANITLIIINNGIDMTKLGIVSIPFDYMGANMYDYVISILQNTGKQASKNILDEGPSTSERNKWKIVNSNQY